MRMASVTEPFPSRRLRLPPRARARGWAPGSKQQVRFLGVVGRYSRARARSLAKTIIHNAATSAAVAAAALPESIRHEPQFSNWLPSLPVASHTSAPFCAATSTPRVKETRH